MQVIYVTYDGEKFEDEAEAIEHENKLKKEEEKKKKLAEERKMREKEINNARKTYVDLLKQYNEDYGLRNSFIDLDLDQCIRNWFS